MCRPSRQSKGVFRRGFDLEHEVPKGVVDQRGAPGWRCCRLYLASLQAMLLGPGEVRKKLVVVTAGRCRGVFRGFGRFFIVLLLERFPVFSRKPLFHFFWKPEESTSISLIFSSQNFCFLLMNRGTMLSALVSSGGNWEANIPRNEGKKEAR